MQIKTTYNINLCLCPQDINQIGTRVHLRPPKVAIYI